MEKDLYFEVVENGYHIYDRNDSLFHVFQYEPYIPDKTKTYSENAQLQIDDLTKEQEQFSPQADTDGMLVDHEYRLTLMELGLQL